MSHYTDNQPEPGRAPSKSEDGYEVTMDISNCKPLEEMTCNELEDLAEHSEMPVFYQIKFEKLNEINRDNWYTLEFLDE